jgi:hypothetical protein
MPQSTIPLALTPDSSQIHGHGYENGTLALEFKSNASKVTYHYPNFSPEKYEELKAAPSIGSFFYKNIKNQYPDGSFERMYKPQEADSEGGEA